MRLAAGNVKKVSLELGGKSPNIVFADADLETFARESPYAVFDNTRPGLLRAEPDPRRALGPRTRRRAVRRGDARRVKVGDPADEATEVGTLVSARQRDRVKDYIEIGLGEGATLVVGGDAPTDPALAAGAYLMPTVFDGVDERHAHRARGDLRPGRLRSSRSTPRRRRCGSRTRRPTACRGRSGAATSAGRCARRKALQSGVISVNCKQSVHTEAPFGGYKKSGIGRELGMAALDLYTETKNVFIDLR